MSKKSDIIKNARMDYNTILESAEETAKKRLATEYSDKFNSLINEELKKSGNIKKNVNENLENINDFIDKPEADVENTSSEDNSMEKPEEETITVQKIKEELEMLSTSQDSETEDSDESVSAKLAELKDMISKLISMESENGEEEIELDEPELGDEESELGDEKSELGDENEISDIDNDMVSEESDISDEEINAALADFNYGEDDDIDEAHGVSYAVRRTVGGRTLPNSDHLSSIEKDQEPSSINEEFKNKMNRLISENKKLSKKLNDMRKSVSLNENVLENHKTALVKYRKLLKEMAVTNTNLSHVNDLLLNEKFNNNDRKNIVNEFSTVITIEESTEKYNKLLNESTTKKVVNESLSDIVNESSIQSSASSRVVERTAYSSLNEDEHILKMKKYMNYNGKK